MQGSVDVIGLVTYQGDIPALRWSQHWATLFMWWTTLPTLNCQPAILTCF